MIMYKIIPNNRHTKQRNRQIDAPLTAAMVIKQRCRDMKKMTTKTSSYTGWH